MNDLHGVRLTALASSIIHDRSTGLDRVREHLGIRNRLAMVRDNPKVLDTETVLMCPQNRLGIVDLWIVSHHGQAISNSEVLAHAIQPRAAIMNNGTRKGGQPDAMKIIHSVPGLEDLWQIHFSQLSGQEYTVPGMFIANLVDEAQTAMPIAPFQAPQPGPGALPAPAHNGTAYWIKVSAQQDGTFTVTNARNGFGKTYKGQ